jgi:hypothetical protein
MRDSWDVTIVDVRPETRTASGAMQTETMKIQSSKDKISILPDFVLAGDEQGIYIYKTSDLVNI